jgi:glycosyltransferase involved in cell wall biosynthesis
MFAGNLGMVQGLETVVEAAALLRDRPGSQSIAFVLVGDGADRPRLERMIADRQLSNVSFAGQHPASEMPAFLSAADALLVHLRRSDVADHAIPTKILAYMAAGRPIVCATGGAAADVIRSAGAGVVLPPGDPAALASAIMELASWPAERREQLGRNGRHYVHAHFDKTTVIDGYERLLVAMAARADGHRAAEERT